MLNQYGGGEKKEKLKKMAEGQSIFDWKKKKKPKKLYLTNQTFGFCGFGEFLV